MQTPSAMGMDLRNPKFMPEAMSNVLLGPGVNAVMAENVMRARSNCEVICRDIAAPAVTRQSLGDDLCSHGFCRIELVQQLADLARRHWLVEIIALQFGDASKPEYRNFIGNLDTFRRHFR